MKTRTLFVLAPGCALTAAAWGGDVREETKAMRGTWRPVAAEAGGQKLPDERLKTMKLIVEGDRYTVHVGDVIDKGTIKLDPSQKPKAMDLIGTEGPNKGKTTLAVYELSGDRLEVCYALEGRARPTDFTTRGDAKRFVVAYQREKR